MRWSGIVVLLAGLASICHAAEPSPEFRLPLACRIGIDCWIANYIDWDETEAAADYACGSLSYDGHTGTDFAVQDMRAVRSGVRVLVAADGEVLRIRDNEPESMSAASRARAREAGRECGNGLVIDHGQGWTSQYCHMRRGSIRVTAGQQVAAGDWLGLVGVSGVTEFPHLHFKVEHEGQLIDPFTGSSPGGGCGHSTADSLWDPAALESLSYRRGQIFNAGFAEGVPDPEKMMQGEYRRRRMSCDVPALVAWMEAFGVRRGDRYRFRLFGPDGDLLASQDEVLERTQAKIYRFSGKRRREQCWQEGEYRAEFELLDGEHETSVLSSRSVRLLVNAAETVP